jgi:soluble lytic murein transglycosylase-like protein
MRALLLALKIFITASLLAHSIESLATAKIKKSGQKNVLHTPGNVWDRIRSGMQIPRFSVAPSFVSSTPQTTEQNLPLKIGTPQKNVLIKTTLLSTPNYDDLNRNRLNMIARIGDRSKTKSRLITNAQQKQIVDYVNGIHPESAVVQTRVRTSIEFHRPKDKSASKVEAESVKEHTPIIIKSVANVPLYTGLKTTQLPAEDNNGENQQPNARLAIINERIGKQIAWYSQHSGYLQQVSERARPYIYHIVSGLTANNLPAELALLPIVESAYQPTALSPKSAAGLWQFIPSTGLDFDLTQTEQYDARLDIDASTQAAIRYLSFLKRHFNGDWLLALASYNCGLGRVDDAISRNRANGLPTDYWSLSLPEETQEYVPRFLALSSIFADPKSYGLKLPSIKNEPYFVKVKVERPFDIDYLSKKNFSTIAELANLSYEQFVQLNPGYLKPTLETEGPFTLLLPANNAKHLHQHLSHVEQFLTEPSLLMTIAPLQKRALAEDSKKILSTSIVSSLANKLPRFISPLLSLKLNTNQTTPRITNQPIFNDNWAMTGDVVMAT